MTNDVSEIANKTTADYKQISELVHERNTYYKALQDAQKELAFYLTPESGMVAGECIDKLIGILDGRKLVELMKVK